LYRHSYGLFERALHSLALGSKSVAELSFELDQRLVKDDPTAITAERHVFITGLARAGTTLLMRQFYATGRYRSITYCDMPFVLAPNLWRRVSSLSRVDLQAAGRSHGDGMLVDGDSPESLEEVFWRVFAGDEYLSHGLLRPHAPDDETLRKYVLYVNAVLSSDGRARRLYLSKNNNNIIRLPAVRGAFPNALILIPFRAPLQQACSLLQQHERFTKMQSEQKFVLSYMSWIGRHDFGLGHRRLDCGHTGDRQTFMPNSINYWLKLWFDAYSWIEKTKPEGSYFVCYEDLCQYPDVREKIANLAGLSRRDLCVDSLSNRKWDVSADGECKISDQAAELYSRLVVQSRAELHALDDARS
jgi:hypothetical protein